MFGYPVEDVIGGVAIFAALVFVAWKFIWPRLNKGSSSSGVGGRGSSGPKTHKK